MRDGVLEGNLVIKGSGDPKLVLERLWLLLRRVQQLGVREIRGDIVLDRSAFAVPEQHPGDFDGEPLRPYNVRPDALLLNYKSVLLSFTPDAGARRRAASASSRALAGVRVDAQRAAVGRGACDDWRGALKRRLQRPAARALRRQLPARLRREARGRSPTPIRRATTSALLGGLWRELGGKLGGSVRDGSAPADAAELRARPRRRWPRWCATSTSSATT